jgi:hypothetical protein
VIKKNTAKAEGKPQLTLLAWFNNPLSIKFAKEVLGYIVAHCKLNTMADAETVKQVMMLNIRVPSNLGVAETFSRLLANNNLYAITGT